MLQRALIKLDKTQKNCYRNDLMMCIVVHETCCQKINMDCR